MYYINFRFSSKINHRFLYASVTRGPVFQRYPSLRKSLLKQRTSSWTDTSGKAICRWRSLVARMAQYQSIISCRHGISKVKINLKMVPFPSHCTRIYSA